MISAGLLSMATSFGKVAFTTKELCTIDTKAAILKIFNLRTLNSQVQGNNERNRNATKRIASARMPMQRNYDNWRTYRCKPHTSFAIMPPKLVGVENSTVLERKKFAFAAR